jgi:threonine dehydrogenase-like Zn-dependent dehydrogenase
MKAWRVYGIGDMRLDEVPRPTVKPGWVLLKTKVVQPSITECQSFQGVGKLDVTKLVKEKGPVQLFGHEFCGEVVEIGKGVRNLKVGDRAFRIRTQAACHECVLCQAGHEERCRKGPAVGSSIPGLFAEFAAIPADNLFPVPDTLTDSEAAAMQSLTASIDFIVPAGIETGDTVVILGQGTMGFHIMQVCRYYGAGKIIVTDLFDEMLDLSRKLGADVAINAAKTDPVDAIMQATGGFGADVVFECAGGSTRLGLAGTKTLDHAIKVIRDSGTIVQVGQLSPGVVIDPAFVHQKGVRYVGHNYVTDKDLNYVVQLVVSKKVQLASLITHVLEGIEQVPKAFEITSDKNKYKNLLSAQVIVSK